MAGIVNRVKSIFRKRKRQSQIGSQFENSEVRKDHHPFDVVGHGNGPLSENAPSQHGNGVNHGAHPHHGQGNHNNTPSRPNGNPHHDEHPPHDPTNHPNHQKPHEPPNQHPHPNPHHQNHNGNENVPNIPATTSGQLTIGLRNETSSDTVYAYITGSATANNGALFLLSADARTPYYPPSPSTNGVPIQQDVSIPLGPPGNIVYATIPLIAGGRIWFSIGTPLQFFVNPGPGLVEPSVFNGADPNINTSFGFCEFTFNTSQLFANISYVDFVGLPIALTLLSTAGPKQHVSGLPANGLQTIANELRAQTAKDGQKWSSLIVYNKSGQLLRIFSPNSGILLNPTWFENYWTEYVDNVYQFYANQPLTVDTQAGFGNVNGTTGGSSVLNFGAGGTFAKPTAGDIFSISSGPFATGSNTEANAIIPRLAAAFNRSTLLLSRNQPDGVITSQYYTYPTTNHYSRIVHAANLDGLGYGFPYDDVTPDGGKPQEGAVYSSTPALLRVAVGGANAYVLPGID